MSKIVLYSLLFLNILLLVSGQLVWKYAMEQMDTLTVWNVLRSPWIYAGGLVYMVATGLWFVVLKQMKLSIAYPLQSLAYVFGILAACVLFSEAIPWTRWVGVAVLLVGVWLIALD